MKLTEAQREGLEDLADALRREEESGQKQLPMLLLFIGLAACFVVGFVCQVLA